MEIKKVDFNSPTAAQDFAHSLQSSGFAVLTNHPIDWDEYEQAYKEWEAFLTSDAKDNYPFDPKMQDGFISTELSEKAKGAQVKDFKSFYHLYFPNGRYPNEISEHTRQLFFKVLEVGKTLLSWLDQEMPAEARANLKEALPDMVSVERTLMRVLYYPPITEPLPAGTIRAEAHEDINLITLLPAATQSGLQLKDEHGQWHDVPYSPESLVINIGDMLQEASGGFYRSTSHRVINPTGDAMQHARMTIPTFIHPRSDVFLSENYPTAAQYLDERLRELGLKE